MSMAARIAALLGGRSTTWSTTDKSADITVETGGLLARRSSVAVGAAHPVVKSTTANSGGKFYFEIVRTSPGTTGLNAGLATAAFGLNNATQPGSIAGSVAFLYTFGVIQYAGGNVATLDEVDPGESGRFAVDLSAKLFWASRVGSDWNGSALANPATGVGGIDISAQLPGAAYIVCDLTSVTTAGIGAALNVEGPFVGSVPSGFGLWD